MSEHHQPPTTERQPESAAAGRRPWALDVLLMSCGVLAFLANAYVVTPGWPGPLPLVVQMLLAIPLAVLVPCMSLGLLGLPVWGVRAWRRPGPSRRLALRRLRQAALALLMMGLVWSTLAPLRRATTDVLAAHTAPLIAAIRQYEQTMGRPPATLAALVPHPLAAVPGTGLPGCPTYHYTAFDSVTHRLLWYDLGPAPGGKDMMSSERAYVDRPEAHVALILTVDDTARVTRVVIDPAPPPHAPLAFTAARWQAEGPQRWRMVADLRSHLSVGATTVSALEAWLGAPDGQVVVRETPWEIRVYCPWLGVFIRDIYIYWPTGAYPRQFYGLGAEGTRIGDWAYVHE